MAIENIFKNMTVDDAFKALKNNSEVVFRSLSEYHTGTISGIVKDSNETYIIICDNDNHYSLDYVYFR